MKVVPSATRQTMKGIHAAFKDKLSKRTRQSVKGTADDVNGSGGMGG